MHSSSDSTVFLLARVEKLFRCSASVQHLLVPWLEESLPILLEAIPRCVEITATLASDIDEGEPLIVSTSQFPPPSTTWLRDTTLREDEGELTYLQKPMRTNGGTPGLITFVYHKNPPGEHDDPVQQQFLRHALELITRRMEVSSTVRRLTRMSLTDVLTSVSNRAGLLDYIEQHTAQETPLAALFIDIDHFKRVNDTWGHPVGDAVLGELANILVKEARSRDFVARLGGEEFIVLLQDLPPAAVVSVAERIRKHVERHRFSSEQIAITVSIGAAHRQAGQSVEDVIAMADRFLYNAKSSGRNQVSVSALARTPA